MPSLGFPLRGWGFASPFIVSPPPRSLQDLSRRAPSHHALPLPTIPLYPLAVLPRKPARSLPTAAPSRGIGAQTSHWHSSVQFPGQPARSAPGSPPQTAHLPFPLRRVPHLLFAKRPVVPRTPRAPFRRPPAHRTSQNRRATPSASTANLPSSRATCAARRRAATSASPSSLPCRFPAALAPPAVLGLSSAPNSAKLPRHPWRAFPRKRAGAAAPSSRAPRVSRRPP